MIITSSANSKYDSITPQDITALSKCFQMSFEESFDAISKIPQEIIEINDLRDNFVVDGVRIME